jgi:hypothetical protein
MRIIFPTTLAAFLAALWIKAIYPPASGIADTDFYWHLAYGRWILDHGSLPAGDIFSWSMPGAPYRLTQWLGETLMGAAYETWGLHGTKALSVLLAAATIGFSWLAARRYVHTSFALGIALVCNLITLVIPMRPQLFTFTLLALLAWITAEWMTNGRRKLTYLLVPIMALWVNLHGGYVVGIAFLGLWCVGLWCEAWQSRTLGDRDMWKLTASCAAAVLATLLNPYGLGAWESVLMIGGLRSSTVISEWMPVNLTTEVGWFYLLNLVPYVALIVTGARDRLTHSLLAGVFLVFGILANRQVAMCAAVMSPMIAALLARTPQYERMSVDASDPSRPLAHALVIAALLAVFPWIQNKGDTRWQETINGQYPVNATEFLQSNGLTSRVMSDTLEASYLIYAGIPVFVDGRMDLYRDFFFFDWHLASRGAPGWDAFLAKHHPETILLRNDMALRQAILARGEWKLVWEDDRYSILRPATDTALPSITPRQIAYLDEKGRMTRAYMP